MHGLLVSHLLLTCLLGSVLLTLEVSGSAGAGRLQNIDLIRSYFRCPPCDRAARARCPDTSHCEEVVKEAGFCGCCLTCAQLEGDRCGPHTNRCAQGLKCAPPVGGSAAKSGLQMLLMGEGRCQREREPMYEDDNFIGGF